MRLLAARVLVLSATSLTVAACSKATTPAASADAVASAPDVAVSSPPSADVATATPDAASLASADAAPAAAVPDVTAALDATAASLDATSASLDATSASLDATAASLDATAASLDATAASAPDAAAAPTVVTRPVPATGVYTSAEDAVLVYIEGTRKQDPVMLWSVMTEGARKVLDHVIVKAKAAPVGELAKLELTPAMLVDMTPRAFFEHMVRHAPHADASELARPLTDLVATPTKGADGSERAKVAFKLGKTSCEADAAKDGEGWKVEVSRCSGP